MDHELPESSSIVPSRVHPDARRGLPQLSRAVAAATAALRCTVVSGVLGPGRVTEKVGGRASSRRFCRRRVGPRVAAHPSRVQLELERARDGEDDGAVSAFFQGRLSSGHRLVARKGPSVLNYSTVRR